MAKLDKFAKYAWFVLGWNIVVILWGVFLRASKSGDGCGQHWLTCHGEVIPSAPELKTVIEFSHRITSFLALVAVVALLIWTFKKFSKGSPIRKSAVGSFIFILTEALVGAGLVLTGNTAETLTPTRPFWMAGHLLNTFILLAFLTITARYASGGARLRWNIDRKYLAAIIIGVVAIFIVGISGSIAALSNMLFPSGTRKYLAAIIIGVVAIFIVGISGSIAALSNMLFPSGTLAEGVAKDFSPTSNILLRLRLLHPITAILTSVFLIFLTGWIAKESGKEKNVMRWSNVLSILVLVQLAFGSLTLFMLAPILLQLGHLFLADAIWISYVLLAANFLSEDRVPPLPEAEDPSVAA